MSFCIRTFRLRGTNEEATLLFCSPYLRGMGNGIPDDRQFKIPEEKVKTKN